MFLEQVAQFNPVVRMRLRVFSLQSQLSPELPRKVSLGLNTGRPDPRTGAPVSIAPPTTWLAQLQGPPVQVWRHLVHVNGPVVERRLLVEQKAGLPVPAEAIQVEATRQRLPMTEHRTQARLPRWSQIGNHWVAWSRMQCPSLTRVMRVVVGGALRRAAS